MSKENNVTEELQEQKIVTSYDRKLQKRKEQAEKDKKENLRNRIIGIAAAVVIVVALAFFAVNSYQNVNGTYVKVNGENVTRAEFEYYYSNALNNYYNTYGSYLSLLGVDFTADLTTQMYSDTLSWYDYMVQQAVGMIQEEKAILAEAEANGFEYDAEAKCEEYFASMKQQAEAAGITLKDYLKMSYGVNATESRVKKMIQKGMIAEAYMKEVQAGYAPTEDEIQAYYEENKQYYDSVDFRLTQITAELSEEPSEEEIKKAMAAAKKDAEAAKKTVATEGEEKKDYTKSYMNGLYADWLFDESRKAGDVTVVEDEANHRYYVVAFEKRYLKEERAVDARVITLDSGAQELLDEWKAGAATEESFIELFNENSVDTYTTEGGLYEDLASYQVPSDAVEWLYDEERQYGDTFALDQENVSYILYYVAPGELVWKLDIKSTIENDALAEYLTGLLENSTVEDPNGYLYYLTVAESSAAAE